VTGPRDEAPDGREEALLERPGAGAGGPAAPPRRRGSALLARNPAFAVLALAFCGWLLWDLGPEAAFFFAPRAPIDLGEPGAYHFERARENRLVQVRGELAQQVPVTEARSGNPRTVGWLAGTNLLVDRPGRGGPPVYEGRLLPARARGDYAEAVAVLRARGASLDGRWLVLRDGERPRKKWLPVAGCAILALLAAVNLRALVKHLSA
jgi:hypothetical protein